VGRGREPEDDEAAGVAQDVAHDDADARFTPFGGWRMPVRYGSIRDEHNEVRSAAGKFDVSHMGRVEVTGPDAVRLTNRLTTNDVAALDPGEAQYSTVTDEDGETSHFVGFLEDVTEAKQYEQRIERRLDEFGDVLAAELHSPLSDALELLEGDPGELSETDITAAVETLERTDSLVDDLTEVHAFSVKSREVFETGGTELGDEP
jgi:hypothetical protein